MFKKFLEIIVLVYIYIYIIYNIYYVIYYIIIYYIIYCIHYILYILYFKLYIYYIYIYLLSLFIYISIGQIWWLCWVVIQKMYSKMHPVSCTNTHPDVTDLEIHGIVKNTETWVSWERNITFLWKILTSASDIVSDYCFVAEVTFKYAQPFVTTTHNHYQALRPSTLQR